MAINKKTQVSASVILPRDIYAVVQERAANEDRSASSYMARIILKSLEEEDSYDLDSEEYINKNRAR